MDDLERQLWGLIEPYLAAENVELDDLAVRGGGGARLVRVTVDADGGMDVEAIARPRPKFAWILVKLALRYALLALLAYVMIARLRLHPLGLMAGASSVVAAVSIEAVRVLLKK